MAVKAGQTPRPRIQICMRNGVEFHHSAEYDFQMQPVQKDFIVILPTDQSEGEKVPHSFVWHVEIQIDHVLESLVSHFWNILRVQKLVKSRIVQSVQQQLGNTRLIFGCTHMKRVISEPFLQQRNSYSVKLHRPTTQNQTKDSKTSRFQTYLENYRCVP